MALSERVLEQAKPTLIGWRSLRSEASGSSSFHSDSRRFEVATSCVPLYAGLEQSLQLLEAEGSAETRLARIQRRSQRLWQGLQALPRARPLLEVAPPAGLVSFALEGEVPEATVNRLGQQAIWVRSLDEPDCLRACTHITSTVAEIDLLLHSL